MFLHGAIQLSMHHWNILWFDTPVWFLSLGDDDILQLLRIFYYRAEFTNPV